MTDMTRKHGNHGPVEEGPSILRAPPHNFEMLVGKSQDVEVSDKFLYRNRFSDKVQFLLFFRNRYLQIPLQCAVLHGSLHTACRVPVLNTVPGIGCAETLAVSEQVNGLQQIGFSLPVLP